MDKYDSYANWKQKALLTNDPYLSQTIIKPRRSVGSPLEHCHSQGDANKLHKNVITNESLKHSKSDPSLMRKIDASNAAHGYNGNSPSKVIQHRQMLIHGADNTQKSNSSNQNFENNVRYAENKKQYLDNTRQQNFPNAYYRNDDRHSVGSMNPNGRFQQSNHDSKHLNYEPNMEKLGMNQYANSPNRLQPDYVNPGLQNSSFHHGSPNNKNFHPHMFPRFHQLPPYYDSEYGYPYPHPYPSNIHAPKNENDETVKSLLQLINSQNEQIKSLQSQVERLLKIQEESLKEREKCNCNRNVGLINENYEQNSQFSIQNVNNNPIHPSGNSLKLSRDDSMVLQRHNSTVERNMVGSTNVKEMKKNVACDYNNQNHDGRSNQAARDEQLKNKILEQKVSIGVMTSFEFTVQNNPFAPEAEDHRQYYGQTQTKVDKVRSQSGNEGSSDQGNVSRTCQNVFSRVSNLPLENINEDSESHLSMSQQPSSNFHSSPTVDEFKSSESTNRRNAKNVVVGKNVECNPKLFDYENVENTGGNGRENNASVQKRQYLDNTQQHYENPRRSQSPKTAALNPRVADFSKQCYLESTDCDQHILDNQKLASQIENRNPNYSYLQKFAVNETMKQHNQQMLYASNQQKEFSSPYHLEGQQGSNKSLASQDDECLNDGDLLAQVQEQRPRRSPIAYLKERNKILFQTKNNQDICVEESIVLNSGELEINERPPPSPEPSIHVEMQEYSSDEESDKHGGEMDKQTPKVGWTFYNNVLGQVNQILQNSPITRTLKEKMIDKENIIDDLKNKATVETVKIATMEQLRQLGISFLDNNDPKEVADTSNRK